MTQVAEEVFFLRLPFKIRRQIYVKLGLLWSSDIDLSDTQSGGEWSARDQRLCNRDGLANQLFYVSRAVSEDARAMLYSENKFWVSDQVGCGLRILMNLSPLAWTSLRCISIRLGKGCHDPIDGRFDWNPEVIPNWVQICAQLATYIKQDDQLDLRLVCGAASKETAAAFLDPLRSLPRLNACSIRLEPFWNPTLQEMIMTTIRQTTKYLPTQPSAPFRFPDLPLEIQLHILEYSGLVPSIPLVYNLSQKKFIRQDCRDFRCNARPRPYAYPHPYLLCQGQGCYCPSTNTAFSTAYPCWGIPDALFLVSKMMRQLAASIFYSKNILRVPVYLSNLPNANYPTGAAWCPQTSLFLFPFTEHSWQHLRYIRWEFPKRVMYTFQPNSKQTEDWVNTVIFIFQKFHLAKLTLELDLDCWYHFPGDLNRPRKREVNWALCNRVIEPMTCLRGLKDFFVHILVASSPQNDWIRVGKEQILEQRVMGEDYDSFARGKEHTKVVKYWQ